MKAFLCVMSLCLSQAAYTQVAISGIATSPDPSAMLDIKSTTRGVLIPRMTISQRDMLASPATSLLIYQTDNMPGYYFNSGTPAAPTWTPLYEFPLPYFRQQSNSGPVLTISNTGSGSAILGYNAAPTGDAYGIKGMTMSTAGTGILGIATTTTGTNYGVKGTTSSPQGIGVMGENLTGSGPGLGIFGQTNSPSGTAIYGLNSATNDYNSGILGRAMSTSGIGIYGDAPAATGFTYGVFGKSASSSGFGAAGSGYIGVQGESTYPDGSGVVGINSFESGNGRGVVGRTWSVTGTGVLGVTMTASGTGYGVVGASNYTGGTGVRGTGYKGVAGETTTGFAVYGNATTTTGTNYGVYGNAEGNGGIGVFGRASSSTGVTYGVYGQGLSTAGAGVYGYAANSVGVKGETTNGFSGWFNGGKFYIGGNLGVGTASPGAGIHLKGTGYPGSFMFLEAANANDAGFRLYEGALAQWHIFNSATLDGLQVYNSAVQTAIFIKQSNSYVGIGTTAPGYQLHVGGEAAKTTGTTAWVISSDARLKDVHGNYTKGLQEISALQPVKFNYKTNNPRQLPSGGEQVGFLAQDVQKIFPEAVETAKDGYLDFNIHAINVALVNAVKELKAENELLKARLDKLEKMKNK